jgi:hypothetical protein
MHTSLYYTCSYYFVRVCSMRHKLQPSLPESESLPSVGFFAECLLSGTRQRRLCREPPSVKGALGKKPSAAVPKLTSVSICRVPTAGSRQRCFFAECHAAGTRQRKLCRVSYSDTRQSIFLFF